LFEFLGFVSLAGNFKLFMSSEVAAFPDSMEDPRPTMLDLTGEEVRVLEELGNEITASPSTEVEEFCQQAKSKSARLPLRVKSALDIYYKRGCSNGFFLVRGLRADDEALGDTPAGNIYRRGETTLLSRIQAVLVSSCGAEMIAYEAEGYGRLFQDVVPIQSMSKLQTSVGSTVELEIHTEQAFSKIKPDILCLACLRGDPKANTHIFPVQYILHDMTTEERALLRQPLWLTKVDLSFKMNDQYEFIDGDVRGPMPIISGPADDPKLVFDQDLMSGLTPAADMLVKKIVGIYHNRKLAHNLQPGHILLVDNHRAVHGRSPFFPRWDGKDRFLVRCFAVNDYERTGYARPGHGRVAAAIFS